MKQDITLYNRFLAFLGLQLAKFQFRNDVDRMTTMTNFFSGASNVLITLPVSYEDAMLASNALRDYKNQLKHLHLTVLNSGTRRTSLVDFPHCEVIRMDPLDVNKFSLPTRPLMQRVLHREYDTAIDLNLDFVLYTAYICKASGAKARVGFTRPGSDTFFNVQLNLKSPRTPQAVYEAFVACLSMF